MCHVEWRQRGIWKWWASEKKKGYIIYHSKDYAILLGNVRRFTGMRGRNGPGPNWCRNNLVAFSLGGHMYDKPGEIKIKKKKKRRKATDLFIYRELMVWQGKLWGHVQLHHPNSIQNKQGIHMFPMSIFVIVYV